jgi:(2R)-3-sulfolactate dehydrogenase (NADP+)
MTETETLTLAEIERLSQAALVAAGTLPENAAPVARATAETEADGVSSHGMAYIPIYCEHVRCGKVDGAAVPVAERPAPALVRVDAGAGFAHPAIDSGLAPLVGAAKAHGIAGLSVFNSYNCGVLGVHTRRIAEEGLLGLGFTNAPASIAASGGRRPVVGTNPVSLAAPDGAGGLALLIDQSASVIAKSEIMKHSREGRPLPEGWALDSEGAPTTDPDAALRGTMAPAGDYKGVGLALIVEILSAALSGATLGKDASSFAGTAGGPPRTGQFFIAIDPATSSGGAYADRIGALAGAIRDEDGARLPGDGRASARARALREGVPVATATLDRIRTSMSVGK